MRAAATLVAALAVAVLVAAPSAHAARNAELSISDDQLLIGASQEDIDHELDFIRSLGYDRLSVSAYWRDHVPFPDSPTRPEGFDPADPFSPGYEWTTLDRIVGSAVRAGLEIRMVITTPAPIWATADPARNDPVYRPKPDEYGAFARAVATRYGPFVDTFALVNEPNQAVWLAPQSVDRLPVAPHLYRALAEAAYPQIKAAAPGARVLLGELAPGGSSRHGDRSPLRPLEFLRALGCRDARLRAVRTGPCQGFRAPRADGVSVHPYAFSVKPGRRSTKAGNAALGDGPALLRTLDALTRRRAIIPARGRRLPVYWTEFGYKTRPLDVYEGIPLERQSRYLQMAAYLAWRSPRVRELNQFRMVDGAIEDQYPGERRFRQFQTGLLFRDGAPKPAVFSTQSPFVIARTRLPRGGRTLFWGQVRPGGAHVVTVQRASRARGPFRAFARVRTDARGYFARRLRPRAGWYRYTYAPANDLPSGIFDPSPRTASDVLRVRTVRVRPQPVHEPRR